MDDVAKIQQAELADLMSEMGITPQMLLAFATPDTFASQVAPPPVDELFPGAPTRPEGVQSVRRTPPVDELFPRIVSGKVPASEAPTLKYPRRTR